MGDNPKRLESGWRSYRPRRFGISLRTALCCTIWGRETIFDELSFNAGSSLMRGAAMSEPLSWQPYPDARFA